MEASWALQDPSKSSPEGSLIVLEAQVDPVPRKMSPQESPEKGPRGVPKGSWSGKGEKSKIIEKLKENQYFGGSRGVQEGPQRGLKSSQKAR